jgi:GTPase-associated system helical domain
LIYMAGEEVMHQDLAAWYRTAGIEPDGATLPKRWNAISGFAGDKSTTVELARLFFGLGRPGTEFISAFRGALQNEDPAFKTRDNDHELAVLSGAALIDSIESPDTSIADFTALALVSGAGQNARQTPPVPEIPESAASYLAKRSLERTVFSGPDAAAIGSDGAALLNELKNACASNAVQTLQAPLSRLAAMVQELGTIQLRMSEQLLVQGEETNMLWWLFGQHSRDLKRPLSEIPVPVAALTIGKELADLTLRIPGPSAATAFLDKALRSSKSKLPEKITLQESVNGASTDWRQALIDARWAGLLSDLTPVLTAVEISLSTTKDDDWLPAFEHSAGFSAKTRFAPLGLAYQVYLECLLHRSWSEQPS